MSFIHGVADLVYSPEGIKKAEEYARSRGVDPTKFRYPWTVSGSDASRFKGHTGKYPHFLFPDTLFIPLVDFQDPSVLTGFEMRYLGTNENRTRFMKIKDQEQVFPLYFTQDLQSFSEETPLIVTEGVIDAESIRDIGFPIISALTAMHGMKWVLFLYAISKRIYLAYDNDKGGNSACENIFKDIEGDSILKKAFTRLSFPGKDLNEALFTVTKSNLLKMLQNQIL